MDDGATGAGGERLDERAVAESLIHEEFADAGVATQPRSHRAGVLGGLAVVGILLAVLVLVSPGASPPKLPAQNVHDLGPVTTVPRSADATSTTTPAPSSPLPAFASPTTLPQGGGSHGVTVRTTPPAPNGPSLLTSSAPSAANPATPAPTTSTTVATPPPTTTTTNPPATTTTTPTATTTTTSCFLGVFCG